jgi:hypothetical protein
MGGIYNLVNAQLYHYAGNNPVKYTDPDGRMPTVVIGAIIGGAVGAVVGGVSTAVTGGSWQEVVSSTVTSAASGAVYGAIAGTGVGIVGLVVAGGVTSAAGSVANEVMAAGLKDGIEGIAGLDPIKVGVKAGVDGTIGAISAGVATKIPTSELAKPIARIAEKAVMANSATMSNAALSTAVKGARNIATASTGIAIDAVTATATTVIQDQAKKFVDQNWAK